MKLVRIAAGLTIGLFAASSVSAASIVTLASFNGANGATPFGSLIADASGTLYGTTPGGGASSSGTVFRIDGSGFNVGGGAVPEPGTWALMIGGFGMAGAMLRRPRAVAA